MKTFCKSQSNKPWPSTYWERVGRKEFILTNKSCFREETDVTSASLLLTDWTEDCKHILPLSSVLCTFLGPCLYADPSPLLTVFPSATLLNLPEDTQNTLKISELSEMSCSSQPPPPKWGRILCWVKAKCHFQNGLWIIFATHLPNKKLEKQERLNCFFSHWDLIFFLFKWPFRYKKDSFVLSAYLDQWVYYLKCQAFCLIHYAPPNYHLLSFCGCLFCHPKAMHNNFQSLIIHDQWILQFLSAFDCLTTHFQVWNWNFFCLGNMHFCDSLIFKFCAISFIRVWGASVIKSLKR